MSTYVNDSSRVLRLAYYGDVAVQTFHVMGSGDTDADDAIEVAFGVIPVTPRLRHAGIDPTMIDDAERQLVKAIMALEVLKT